jgi:hypothetical protein
MLLQVKDNLGHSREEGMPLKTGTPVTTGTLAATCISTSATFRMSETAGKEDKQGSSIIQNIVKATAEIQCSD